MIRAAVPSNVPTAMPAGHGDVALRDGFRRRGVTLTELVVTATVLLIVAAMVVPEAAKFKDNQQARDLVPSVQRLIAYAREEAISRHTTAVLTYDQGTTSLTVKQDTTVDQYAPTISVNSASQGVGSSPLVAANGVTQIAVPSAPTVDPANPTINRTVAVPTSMQLTDFQLAGNTVSQPDFQLHFYRDGTCDGGGIGFTLAKATQSITIDAFGRSKLVDGALPDPTTQLWQAGQFEPRQDVTQ